MTFVLRLVCLAAVLMAGVPAGLPAQAETGSGTEITFTTPPVPPTPFKLKRAQAKGITLEPTPGIDVTGTLYRPEGDGPFPAIILLVSGDGVRQSHHDWSRQLVDWGYIALLVDSFASRGGTSFTDTTGTDVQADGFGAYLYLQAHGDVLADRIGFLGFSLGASRLFTMLEPDNRFKPDGFAPMVAIGFYPVCPPSGTVSAPLLILLGEADRLADSASCRSFADGSNGQAALTLYPGIGHFFDNPEYGPSYVRQKPTDPAWYADLSYDAAAHQDSVAQVRSFLQSVSN